MRKKVGKYLVSYNVERYLREVLTDNEYRFLNYYPVIVDVGANIGTFSLNMYDNADRIFAIELSEENLDCLKATIADNKLKKITPLLMAISGKSVVQKIDRNGDPGMGGWKLSEAGDQLVDCRTLSDFMESQGIEYIDLLKLDVEGEELNILSAPFFPHDKVGTIIGEYHGQGMQHYIGRVLEWMGYRYMDLGNNHFIARK